MLNDNDFTAACTPWRDVGIRYEDFLLLKSDITRPLLFGSLCPVCKIEPFLPEYCSDILYGWQFGK